jgi:N-acetylmuramoyl-L-alanine amidase
MKALAVTAVLVLASPAAAAALSERDVRDIALVIYHEGRDQPFAGQLAIAHVVLNRRDDPRFPKSITGVVRQPGAFSSLAHERSVVDLAAWRQALTVARIAAQDRDGDPTHGATYFDGTEARPSWLPAMRRLAVIGDHAFYREMR